MSDSERPDEQPPVGSTTLIQAGAVFGDLKLVREIGRGSQGIVYEGLQRSVGRRVAVKILPKETTFTSEQVDRFHREAEAAGRMTHPNIVAVYGMEESGGHLMLLQEMVTGGDLTDWMEDPPEAGTPMQKADAVEAADFVRTIAGALHHAHENGVIHRDIKPENILLTEAGVPKLTDFGLARMEDKLGLSQTGAIMGTPHYMSPEQVTARPSDIDARTDVYSLGCLLYRLLTGVVPFDGNNLQGIFLDILHRAPRSPRSLRPGMHADLEAVCLKALEKAPDDRYQTAQELADDLGRYLEGQTTLARPVGSLVRTVRTLNRMATSSLALLVVLVPVVWLAVDALALRPMAQQRIALHDLRLGLVAVTALVLLWPLTLLARRRFDGRNRLATGAAAVLTLALAAPAAWLVREQALDQEQGVDRVALSERLDGETLGSRPEVGDLEEYEAEWSSRLGADDALLLARGYLKRERPLAALAWVDRIGAQLVGSPVQDALLLAAQDALGMADEAAQAEARLRADEDAHWSAWILAGDVLSEMRRPLLARTAYLRAGPQDGAPRDALNLELARVSNLLCQWEEASSYLDDYRRWFPDDIAGQLVLYQVAVGEGRFGDAEQLLDAYAVHPGISPNAVATMRYELAGVRGKEDEAWQVVLDAARDHPLDGDVLTWTAARAIDQADALIRKRAGAFASGDAEGVVIFGEAAAAALFLARQQYERYAGLDDAGGLIPELGFTAVLLKRADLEADASGEHRASLLEQAVTHAEAAVAADPSYWQAHYNLGHARLTLARHQAGGFAGMSVADLESYVSDMREVLVRNGLHAQSLNNAAYVLGKQLFPRTSDRGQLDEAVALAERAVRLADPRRSGGACKEGESERSAYSSAWDTLAGLQELGGDVGAAFASAERARDALLITDASYAVRKANVERLAALR